MDQGRTRLAGVVDITPVDDGHHHRMQGQALVRQAVMMAIVHWGDVHYAGDEGPPLTHRHKTCGCDFTPVQTCSACGEEVVARDVEVRGAV